jgi:hypothetical protein
VPVHVPYIQGVSTHAAPVERTESVQPCDTCNREFVFYLGYQSGERGCPLASSDCLAAWLVTLCKRQCLRLSTVVISFINSLDSSCNCAGFGALSCRHLHSCQRIGNTGASQAPRNHISRPRRIE